MALALLLAACAAPPAPAPAVSATALPPIATVPAVTAEPFHTPDTRTGVPVVDEVIAAYLAGDTVALVALVDFAVTPCTHANGLGGPPKCAEGQAEGTEVEVFPGRGRKARLSPAKR